MVDVDKVLDEAGLTNPHVREYVSYWAGVTGAERINYEILGNVEPALHAHVIPRYAWEAPAQRQTAVWLHDWSSAPRFAAERDRPLATALAAQLGAASGIHQEQP